MKGVGTVESAATTGRAETARFRAEPAVDAPVTGRVLLWLGVLAGGAFYIADAAVHALLQGRGSFVDQLLRPSAGDLWLRIGALGCVLALVAYAYGLLRRERRQAREARTTERFLSSVVENIPDMVFIKDAAQLRFMRVNRAGERLLGLAAKDLIGKSDYDLFPRAQADSFTWKDREVLASGMLQDIPEEEIDTGALGKRLLHTKKVPVYGDDGQPAFLLGIAEDITERREAERRIQAEQARAEHYLLISRALIVGLDLQRRVTLINPRGCEILGRTESEILGSDWFESVIPERIRTDEIEIFDGIISGDRRPDGHHESEILTKSGETRYVAWNHSPQADARGRIGGILCSGQDITDRVRAEADAQRHHRELAHVMRLGTMGEMASGMAHEINQPLTAVTAYLGAAIAFLEKDATATPQAIHAVQRALDQVHRAGRIIERLREFVRKGNTTRDLVELDLVIRSVIDFVDWELRNSQVRLELRLHAPGLAVRADRVQIEQVLVNLIRNAMESLATAEVSPRRVIVTSGASANANVRVTVEDNGPGIEGSVRSKLFEPFQTTKEQGLGIGLSISCSIIEAHDGRMWAESEPGNGATVGFELPCARLQSPP